MTTQITPEQSSLAALMLRECGDHHSAEIIESLAAQVDALKVERDAALAASRYETDLCGQALADLKTMTAERVTLQAQGKHPAPCARHCEARAFEIVISGLKAEAIAAAMAVQP